MDVTMQLVKGVGDGCLTHYFGDFCMDDFRRVLVKWGFTDEQRKKIAEAFIDYHYSRPPKLKSDAEIIRWYGKNGDILSIQKVALTIHVYED